MSGLCSIPFALRVARCLAAVVHGSPCIAWYHCAPSSHISSAFTPATQSSSHTPIHHTAPLIQLPQRTPVLSFMAATLWHGDISHFTSVVGRIALLMGEVAVLHIVSRLLERAVCFLFLHSTFANTMCHVVAHFDGSRCARSGN